MTPPPLAARPIRGLTLLSCHADGAAWVYVYRRTGAHVAPNAGHYTALAGWRVVGLTQGTTGNEVTVRVSVRREESEKTNG